MSDSIQDLLAGILDEGPTLKPEQSVAVNEAGGDMGEAVMSSPDLFDGDDAPLSLPTPCPACGVPFPDDDATECVACGAVRREGNLCQNAWHDMPTIPAGSKCLSCGMVAGAKGNDTAPAARKPTEEEAAALAGPEGDLTSKVEKPKPAEPEESALPAAAAMGGFEAALAVAGAGHADLTEDELEEQDSGIGAVGGTPVEDPAEQATGKPKPEAPTVPTVETPTFTNEEVAESLDIRQFATLVTLQTSRWHAKVKDRQASKDAATASGADAAAFETQKRLLVGADEKLKRIHKAIDTARTQHYAMTLPWSTVEAGATAGKRTGGRLLPNTLFMEYTTAMAKCKAEMDTAIAEFVPAYPGLIAIAQKRLGTRFNPTEYPNASAIQSHFALSFDFLPIPQGGDFQGLADAQVKKLAKTLNKKTATMLENAMQEAWTRLYEIVEHAATKLSDPDAMFHYTMVDKLREAAKLIKHLNITADARIETVRAFVEKNLTMHEVKEIRKDDALRSTLAGYAKSALAQMQAET